MKNTNNQKETSQETKPKIDEMEANDKDEDNVYIFDEPDDELEEFEEMGSVSINTDTDLENWDEDWGAAGWDDEDDDDDRFITKVEHELRNFQANLESEKDPKGAL